ncbi:MAG: histidine triad family protein [Frankiaceae bacterium]|jgi:histidine triad (HIT) family protein|nr:histidine triad family protein [Frankiaceae bacterium]MDQ1698152.1 histidine triad family protein [Frankiaceae bacterium]
MADDCLFCRIATGEIPADMVATSDEALAFRDITPVSPTHVLVIPRAHWANLAEVAAGAPQTLVDMVRLAAEVADLEGVSGDGYRLVANTGPAAHQTVFHAHLHVLAGRSQGWPPG